MTNSQSTRLETLRQIPPLMPEFLRKRRVGLPAMREISAELGIEPPLLVTLRWMGEVQGSYGGQSVTVAELRGRSRYLYSTIDNLTPQLSALVGKGLLIGDRDAELALSERAREAVERLHAAGRAHVAALQPDHPLILDEIAKHLERAVQAVCSDSVLAPRPGSHLAGSRSLATFGNDAPAMVRIEQAIYDLWMARDDAHIKAWRDAELEGPPLVVLTLLWRAMAGSISELSEILSHDQTPDDVEANVTYLVEKDYAQRDGDNVQLTPAGVLVREDIERETDRIYFAPWRHTQEEAKWLLGKLSEIVDNLPTPAGK